MVLFVVGDVNPENIRDIVETHENKRIRRTSLALNEQLLMNQQML